MAQGASSNRSGYGPLIIPPLLIITVLSFGFIYMESLLLAQPKESSTAASSTKPTTVKKETTNIPIVPTQYKEFQALQTVAPSAPAAAVTPTAPVATTSPQPTVTSTANNPLQSAAQNSKNSSSDYTKAILNAINNLKVNTSTKQNLTNKK